jgi:hypothetical protein
VDLGPSQDGTKILAPTGIRSPDRPVRSESLYRLCHTGSHNNNNKRSDALAVGPSSVVRQLVTTETYKCCSREIWRSHVVLQKTHFFWDVTPRLLANSYQCLKGSFSLHP